MGTAVRAHTDALRELFRLLHRYRHLTWALAWRELRDRYAGQFFGILWAVGHPLLLLGIYIFVFVYAFKVKLGVDVGSHFDYTTYILAGLIPWLALQEGMVKASLVIVGNANLVKQVIFPIEILPVKGVLVALLTQLVGTLVLVAYVLINFGGLPWTYALLPVLLLAQGLAMVGLTYILATLGVYLRDTKDFLQVFCVVNLYAMPLFYLPGWVPGRLQVLFYLNPFSYFAWCYQDACFYGRFEHPWAWPVFLVGSVVLCAVGYRLFRRLKPHFGSVL